MGPVELEVRDRVAVITINRPEARNAINPEVAQGIEAAIDRLEEDADLRAGVLTGAPPVFCAGADLKAIGAGLADHLWTERGGFGGLVRRERRKPLIAAVDGAALAGGTELVLSCDMVIASSGSTFGLPEVKRGLIAGAGGLFRLGRRLPPNLAMEHILTGDPLTAELAHAHGLVNHLCAVGEAVTEAVALAERIVANGPLAVQVSREVLLGSEDFDEAAAWERTIAANEVILASADVREGVQAFIEKRPPVWTGR